MYFEHLGSGFAACLTHVSPHGPKWLNVAARATTHVGNVIPGQQDLSNGLCHVGKQTVPEADEAALAYCGQSLALKLAG
mgnify:CR=1 FL=1